MTSCSSGGWESKTICKGILAEILWLWRMFGVEKCGRLNQVWSVLSRAWKVSSGIGNLNIYICKSPCSGTSLAVQWSGIRASTAGGTGSMSGQGAQILRALWCFPPPAPKKARVPFWTSLLCTFLVHGHCIFSTQICRICIFREAMSLCIIPQSLQPSLTELGISRVRISQTPVGILFSLQIPRRKGVKMRLRISDRKNVQSFLDQRGSELHEFSLERIHGERELWTWFENLWQICGSL